MVGIVLVSHSRPLAIAVQGLVRSMTGPALPIAMAAGAGENHAELGTDAVEISEAIRSVQGREGVLVLMDMGSAILSSETALDLLEPKDRWNIRFCSAPFVEGAVAAGVTANLGAALTEVYNEALASLAQKERALQGDTREASPAPEAIPGEESPRLSARLIVRNAHGLHARPAACLIRSTQPFHAEITIRNISNGRGPVPVRSLSRVASLEILEGHEIEVSASGPDAATALEKITQLAQTGFGEALSPARPPTAMTGAAAAGTSPSLPISEGIAIGPGFYFRATSFDIPQNRITDIPAEIDRLQGAVTAVQGSLENQRTEMTARAGASEAGIYEAQILALQDPQWVGTARQLISDDRKNAALAWDEASRQVITGYTALQDDYLRERAADMEDIARQVLEKLAVKPVGGPVVTEPSILIADDLTPTQVSGLRRDLVPGVIVLDGGPTAHSSILLKALGFPAVVRARSAFSAQDLSDPGLIAFDGATGEIWRHPDPALLGKIRDRQSVQQKQARAEEEASSRPAATLDGHRVQVFANIGSEAEVAAAVKSGAEGIGLLRTEFLFLDRGTAPTESEQAGVLRKIAAGLGDRPMIVRTLDIGGDKPAPYLEMPPENNPFLGVRALRLCFSREELFTTHLRAILQAAQGRDFRIMFPMVADVVDLKRARTCLVKAHETLEKEKISHLWPIPVGVMIEIPSAALQAESLAEHVDFFSIGTNDLTQYTLAADRGNAALADYQDSAHPAVLRLVELVVRGARKLGRLVAVCGEAGSDPLTALLFVGLGVEELSVTPGKIPRLKAILRGHKLGSLQGLAQRALQCESSVEVRGLSIT